MTCSADTNLPFNNKIVASTAGPCGGAFCSIKDTPVLVKVDVSLLEISSPYCDTEAVSKHVADEERAQNKVQLGRCLLTAWNARFEMAKWCVRMKNVSFCIVQSERKTSHITSQSGLCRVVCTAAVRGADWWPTASYIETVVFKCNWYCDIIRLRRLCRSLWLASVTVSFTWLPFFKYIKH